MCRDLRAISSFLISRMAQAQNLLAVGPNEVALQGDPFVCAQVQRTQTLLSLDIKRATPMDSLSIEIVSKMQSIIEQLLIVSRVHYIDERDRND